MIDLKRLRELLDKATPGPWGDEEAACIAALRNAAPALLRLAEAAMVFIANADEHVDGGPHFDLDDWDNLKAAALTEPDQPEEQP